MALAEFYITDGSEIVNLLGANNGPAGVGLDGAKFSRPVRDTAGIFAKTYAPVEESYTIKIAAGSQNEAISYQQALDRMIEKAINYWQTPEPTPVWIVSRAASETGPRYAVIMAGALRAYGDIYDQPFVTATGESAMIDLELAITRSAWQATPPMDPACFPISSSTPWQNFANSWGNLLSSATKAKGIYWVKSNGNLFVGYRSAIKMSSDNGATWPTTVKTFTTGNIAQAFTIAFGKLFIAVANDTAVNADSGVWSCTLTGGSVTQEISGVNYYSITTRPSDGAVLAGGTDVIKIKTSSAGSWATHSSAVKGSPTCLVFTDTGALIAADTYDVWRAPAGGTLARVDSDILGPYKGITYFKKRLILVSSNYTALSTDDGQSWSVLDVTGGDAVYYHAGHDMVYRANSNTVRKSVDDGRSWYVDTSSITAPGGGFTQTATGAALLTTDGFVVQRINTTNTAGTRSETCYTKTVIGNRPGSPALTHVMILDSPSTFSSYAGGNYLAAGSNIFPAAMATGDIAYFGSTDAHGYFNSLVFDIVTSNKTATLAYEYWNGTTWATIPQTVDKTYQLSVSGSISWPQPSDWVQTAINGVTALWVRIRVTAPGAITATPVAKNVYAPNTNWLEVTGIAGDIPALARLKLINLSDGGVGTNQSDTGAIMVGLRSVDRGEFFTSMLTIEATQNYANIVGGEAAIPIGSNVNMNSAGESADILNPALAATGRYTLYTPVTLNAWNTVGIVGIGAQVSQSFYGTFRAFIRYFFYGTDSAVKVRLGVQDMPGAAYRYGPERTLRTVVATAGGMRLLDLGQINLGGDRIYAGTDKSAAISIRIQMQSSVASTPGQVGFADLILMPVDEWAGYFADTDKTGVSAVGAFNSIYLDIDSATAPKRPLRAIARSIGGDLMTGNWSASASGPMVLQPGKRQRLYILTEMWNSEYFAAPYNQVYQAKLYAHERYLGMRGND